MITLTILLLAALVLMIFTILSIVMVGGVGIVLFGDIFVAILIIVWVVKRLRKK